MVSGGIWRVAYLTRLVKQDAATPSFRLVLVVRRSKR
jgi:hypothetical protein